MTQDRDSYGSKRRADCVAQDTSICTLSLGLENVEDKTAIVGVLWIVREQ